MGCIHFLWGEWFKRAEDGSSMSIKVIRAQTLKELKVASEIRWQVYGEEMPFLDRGRRSLGMEVSEIDLLETSFIYIGYVDGVPAATLRMCAVNQEMAEFSGTHFGFSVERYVNLSLLPRDTAFVEMTRSLVLRKFRRTGVMLEILRAACRDCLALDPRMHCFGAANMMTNSAVEADIMKRILDLRGRYSAEPAAAARNDDVRKRGNIFFYSEEERASLLSGLSAESNVPRPLEFFDGICNVQFIGEPFFDPDLNIYTMPLLKDMAVLSRKLGPSPYDKASKPVLSLCESVPA